MYYGLLQRLHIQAITTLMLSWWSYNYSWKNCCSGFRSHYPSALTGNNLCSRASRKGSKKPFTA